MSFPKTLLLVGLLAASSEVAAQETGANQPAHLFILSGQSNMVGLDPNASFTPTVAEEFGEENVIVVKDAKGGEPIHRWYKDWQMEGVEAPKTRGALYDRLMKKVRAAIDRRKLASVTFVWMQGERDARENFGRVYAECLKGLLKQLSADLSRNDINCVIGRLSDFDMANKRYPDWTIVREAQVEFAKTTPRCVWVDTDDLNDGMNRRGKPIKDDLHYSVKGYESLGRRFAHKAIALIKETRRPNIILVMADDQGWGDAGYNGHPFVRTPELDAMAKAGFVFDRFYAAAPVCSPTRASVMTGRNPIRAKVTNHGRYMRPHEQTIAESLKDAGYITGIFGKVHLGSGQPDSPCNPSGMGFDEWVVGLNFYDNDPYLSRNGTIEHRKGKGSALAMDDALAFLNKHKKRDHPMFMVVWFPSPHDPHQEVPEGPSLYEGKKQAGYYREITLLDQQVGRLRKELRHMEIADNTIVWYCSDNGGLVESTSGGRERKGSIYEGGLRIPGIIEWPARNLQGRTAVPAWTCDIYPTLLAMAEVHSDTSHPLDGIDIGGIISGEDDRRSKPMGFWHNFQRGQATRSDHIQKAILEKQQAKSPLPHNQHRIRKDVDEFPQFADETSNGHAAWNDWPWKLHRINGKKYELYNLADDPMETTDRSGDPQQQDRLARMQQELDTWMRSVVRSINGKDYQDIDLAREIQPAKADYSELAFYPDRWTKAGVDFDMLAWEGSKVVFMTQKGDYDASKVTAFVKRLDDGWQTYSELVGQQPRRFKNVGDKPVICAIPKSNLSCGYGCGFVGATGIEASAFYSVDLPNFRKQPDSFQHYYFYEMGRNFFVFGDRHSLFTTGFAVFMRYVCMDRLECKDLDAQTRRTIEHCEEIYAKSDIGFFDAFTNLGSGEKSNRLKDAGGRVISPSDQPVMYATAMLKLRRDCGGDEWVKNFLHTLRRCTPARAKDVESARTQVFNWLVCASVAAERDLTPVFSDRWRMPLTENQRHIMKRTDWSMENFDVTKLVADLVADLAIPRPQEKGSRTQSARPRYRSNSQPQGKHHGQLATRHLRFRHPYLRAGCLLLVLSANGWGQADDHGEDQQARKDGSSEPMHFVIVSKTHFDIGYSALARDVIHEYRTTMIDRALATIEQNAKVAGPDEGYVWTVPGWPMRTILWDGQNPQRRKRVEAALTQEKPGDARAAVHVAHRDG